MLKAVPEKTAARWVYIEWWSYANCGNMIASKRSWLSLKVQNLRKNGQHKRATYFETLLLNELKSDDARFTIHESKLSCNKSSCFRLWEVVTESIVKSVYVASTCFVARQFWTWVVKRTTWLFNSFCSNVQKHVLFFFFCLPFYYSFNKKKINSGAPARVAEPHC